MVFFIIPLNDLFQRYAIYYGTYSEVTMQQPTIPVTQKLTFLRFFQILASRKKMITLVTSGAAMLTVIVTLLLPKTYLATTKIYPPQQQGGSMAAALMQGVAAGIGGDLLGDKSPSKLYSELLKVDSLRDQIIDRFKLMARYKKNVRQDIYPILKHDVSVQVGKEGIITINVVDKDPKMAADMANAFVEELQRLTVSLNITGAGSNRAFLEERLAKVKAELDLSENQLKKYQTDYQALSAPQQAEATMKTLAELTAQLNAREIELSILRRTLSDSTQEVKNMKQSIAVLKSQITRFEKGSGSGMVPAFGAIPEREKIFLNLMRTFKTNEATHELLSKQLELAKLSEANDVSALQIIQKAVPPERKYRPERAKIVLAYTFTAFVMAVVLALVQEYLNNMPTDRKEQWLALVRKN